MNNGAFGENFPYSNFHDLNMDWIIKIAKDFLDQYTSIQTTIDNGITELENKATSLEELLDQWYDTHSEDIANQLADALEDLNNWYTEHQNYLNTYLIDSIREFNASAEAKAEETLESIPEDYTELSNKVNYISEYTYNLFPYESTGDFLQQKEYDFELPAGTYTLYAITETDNIDRDGMNVVFVYANDSITSVRLRKNQVSRSAFTLTSNCVKIRFQSADGYPYSAGYTGNYSNIMIYSGTEYKEYIPHIIAVDDKCRNILEEKQDYLFTFEQEFDATYASGAVDYSGVHNPSGVGRTTQISVEPDSIIKITGHKFNQYFPLGIFYHDSDFIEVIPGTFANDTDHTVILRVPTNANSVIVNGDSDSKLATVSKIRKYTNNDFDNIIVNSDNKWTLDKDIIIDDTSVLLDFHLKAGTYTLKLLGYSNSDTQTMAVYFYDRAGNALNVNYNKNYYYPIIFTLTQDCVQVRFYAGNSYGTSTGKNGEVHNISISEGYINPPYEYPYTAKDTVARSQLNNYWYGKKIVWFGTSIPAGRTDSDGNRIAYPNMIGDYLGAKVYNEAIGSSGVRFGAHDYSTENDPRGLAGCWALETMLSLSASVPEKEQIMTDWDSKWKNILPGANSVDITNNRQMYLNSSWDICLAKYLSGGLIGQCDLYIFDHGHNDIIVSGDSSELTDVPPVRPNRAYFLGAMDFLITKILEDNPRARIMFIGHYENDRKTGVSEAQEMLNSIWGYPLCKTWEKMGWSQNTVTINNETKTITQIWMPDDIHPASDLTNKALKHYRDVVGAFIKNNP